MSRISNRISSIVAGLTIIFLIVFLVIIWTSIRTTDTTYGNESQVTNLSEPHRIFLEDKQQNVGSQLITSGPNTNFFVHENDDLEEQTDNLSWKDEIQSNFKGDIEYVRPLKISRNQYEDPPTESTSSKRHHTGHFRHSKAEVWDPHPQYEFTAFGKRFRLRLSHDNSFISQNIKVTHVSQNKTKWEHPGHQLGCYYSGVVDGDPKSVVSVSLCQGMTGHMKTSTGTYIIKPTANWSGDEDTSATVSSLQHAIYRVSATRTNTNDVDLPDNVGHNCGVIDYDTADDVPAPLNDDLPAKDYIENHLRERRSLSEKIYIDRSIEDEDDYDDENTREFGEFVKHHKEYSYQGSPKTRYNEVRERYKETEDSGSSDVFASWRPRRALPQEYFIEIMVVADAKMIEYHGDNLVAYVLILMSTVSRIYKDPSIGNPISIAVTKVIQTNEVFGTKHDGVDGIAAADMLKRFCYWQKHNNPDEPSPEHHDAALLLTRENLCHNPGQRRCDTLGLAELGRMCSPGSSCAIVQDNGLAAAFTIAHELGHVFNMPHDDDSKCAKYRNRSRVYKVMSRMLDDNTFPWEWSKCSRHYVTEFLEAGYANCLLDQPRDMIRSDAGRLPGEDYSENKQCELVFGPRSKICSRMDKDVCKRLWCTTPSWNNQTQCHTQHMPWADGTPCSAGKWCQRGECVSRRNLAPVDGQWGEWGRYGECSRTCGGGVKKKYRECNNPPPQNGGNYCVGERVKYRSCGTKECPQGTPDFREQQCAMSNYNNHNIQNLPRNVKWHAKYIKVPPEDRCKLYCQVESNQYYMLRDKVIDGTPCGLDTFHICVNGRCRPAGCDHVLNSTAELDACGVCRGDNSTCQRITGTFNSSGVDGYRRVTKIPAGSSYIDIKQYGWGSSHNDSNYLALRLGERGEYILNGNYMVMHRKVIVLPGIAIEYSGPGSVVERLNSSRPIGVDLILELLSVGGVVPPQITYEYTVPKKILGNYTWILNDWSSCSHMCQGKKHRRAECQSTEHQDVVSDDYCKPEDKPREESQSCNTHCTLQWHITSVSECSSHCGPGTRMLSFRCVQILASPSSRIYSLPSHACAHLDRPSENETCIGPCKDAHWAYTDWGPCSVSCGGGMQMRTATCIDSKGRMVPDSKCNAAEKILKRSCGQETCPQWHLGEWSPCSVSCGIGTQVRPYWCQVENQIVSESSCNGLPSEREKKCNAGPCQNWSTGEWSPCSVTCGEGTRRRKVVCLRADGSPDDGCAASMKPDSFDTCTLDPCPTVASIPPVIYSSDPPHGESSEQENEIDSNGIIFHSGYAWRTGTFGECSRPCGGGIKYRMVQCTSKETHTAAPDDYCYAHLRPAKSLPCNGHACPLWNTGDWSQCDVKCGDGFQHRQVRCQSPRGDILPDTECNTIEKPRHAKKCWKDCVTDRINNPSSKSSYSRRWRTTNWTPCSKSCGGGIKTRRVECTIKTGRIEQPVKDEQCTRLGLVKPRSQRPCQRIPCDYTWQEGSWSECSAECGEGTQRRAVTCHRTNRYGWIDPTPTDGCPISEKPKGEQRCKLQECTDKFYWTTGPWRKCSHQCGRKGRQIRRLFCLDKAGKKVPRYNCPRQFKPKRKRKCNQRRCGPLTCLDAQKRFKSTKDGEYILLVGGKNMSIYCHAMATNEPREYLTLPAGDRENYAEIYDKRLSDPNKCPYNGQRNDSCHCVDDSGTMSGRTMFKRVRIDVGKLIIIANDYTFSWTNGANRVEYGKAGDCYSLLNCPQGRFSINLSGTSLRLVPEVTWKPLKSRAHLAINRINDQRVYGKCGGYCGFCTPSIGLKLDVLPPWSL
ncbi:A disintegrin and metalloproteinase with thrombospondin motifs 9 isoform X2 [Chelonus insularis]|uniref:A disintegrin and metalloproteinase with thrombospondin motifs 9 isoform X2 n=1 Tax=Chelonus insularis TaxID=460826 RepID=UPI00158B22F6|nr:A disintegrin and metalloproteinase with thrombospondin motifs 9 isoform X2 [Chelonus insularis]